MRYSRSVSPGGVGLEILKDLRARQLHVPTIMMSARGTIRLAVDAIKSGAQDFIEKPFREQVLTQQIEVAAKAFVSKGSSELPKAAHNELLTPSQFEIVSLLANGNSTVGTAEAFGVSAHS
jgi:two-component system, LuxR family, response regulator FixJ